MSFRPEYFRCGDRLFRLSDVSEIDLALLESELVVRFLSGAEWRELKGAESIEFLMLAKPSALEGRKLKWIRHSWSIHNLIGHPVMQFLSWIGFSRLGLRIHDLTVPQPNLTKVRS